MVTTTWDQKAGMTSPTDTDNLESYAEQAEASKDAAAASEAAAAASAAAAAASEVEAESAEANAAASATSAATGAATATTKASEAAASATSASTSATAAQTAQTAAEAAETAAAASETASAASEAAASTSETNAATSASAASTSATNAATSETNAATSATASASSATASAASASAASASETAAAASETAAAASETAAATSETNAATSATSAAGSASAASTSASNAAASEGNAASSASAASTSETNAAASEAAASTSEANSATSETNAATSASASATSATASAGSATASSSSATAAASSETAAATSEGNAATSASNAATSATNAATSETNASTSATAAASSASSASASADAALAALDSFDDRYLGQKASDPTLDNDGNALVAGALYFNTTDDIMKVYDGAAWLAAYASLSGALLATNNLSDVLDAATARTNLGLGTAATTAATDYATAAQGALADSAVQPNDSPSFGSVAVSGTVDGRDIAADGSKLDSIEAGADVTDTANVTAAGALMDSEVTNLAQVKAFSSADYATAAQGSLADSALQSGDNVSALTNDAGYTTNVGDITGVTAGSGITGGGTSGTVTINHADTSSQGSVSNSGATVIQDVTVDTYGHVTGLGSKTLTAADVGAITGNQTITLSGDVSGSGTTSISVTVNNIDGNTFVNSNSGNPVNADTIASNGVSYYTGGVTDFSGNATDGALYSQQYSSSWQHQIAGDYRSGQIAVRGKNNGTWTSWNKVWTQGNDGSGSGLDADLLDGLDSSAFLRSKDRSNWNSSPSVIGAVVGQLGWKNYSNNHTIFDASASTTPSGTACSNTNPNVPWTGTYPTLMGWNGASTYGVRVDSARNADTAGRAYPKRVGNVDLNFNWSGQSGQPPWLWGGSDGSNMYVYNPSNFSVAYAATAGSAPAPSTAQVLSATAGASAGAVGTYILGKTNTTVYFGSNYSSVYASSAYGSYNQLVSGTWKCMGRGGANGPDYVTCFMRIA